jgi:hypothetical protein
VFVVIILLQAWLFPVGHGPWARRKGLFPDNMKLGGRAPFRREERAHSCAHQTLFLILASFCVKEIFFDENGHQSGQAPALFLFLVSLFVSSRVFLCGLFMLLRRLAIGYHRLLFVVVLVCFFASRNVVHPCLAPVFFLQPFLAIIFVALLSLGYFYRSFGDPSGSFFDLLCIIGSQGRTVAPLGAARQPARQQTGSPS